MKQNCNSLLLIICFLCFCLTGCETAENKTEILTVEAINAESDSLASDTGENLKPLKIGALEPTSIELLQQAERLLKEEGYQLDIVEFENVSDMNEALISQKIDAHLFAHIPYIECYNGQNKDQLKSQGVLWYEVYSLYGGLKDDLTFLSNASTVAIPDKGIERARALLFLNDCGIIKVNEKNREFINTDDILENPKDIEFVEISNEEFETAKEKYDYLLCGAFTAAQCGYDTVKDPLMSEKEEMQSVQILGTHLVTADPACNMEGIRALKKAFTDEYMQAYLKYMLKGTVATK